VALDTLDFDNALVLPASSPKRRWGASEDALLISEWSAQAKLTGQAPRGFVAHICCLLPHRTRESIHKRMGRLVMRGVVEKQWKRAKYTPIKLSPVDAAWLAGILDGEGHISFSVCGGRRTVVLGLCANTDGELLARVRRLVPSARMYRNGAVGRDDRGIRSNHQCYTVVLTSVLAIQDVLSQLAPHISHSKKRAKAVEMLDFVEKRLNGNA